MKNQILIMGKNRSGEIFRPSDWAERLCGTLSCFDNPKLFSSTRHQHLSFSSYAYPTVFDRVKSVAVDQRLEQIEPAAYRFILKFSQENELEQLQICLLEEPS
jgi:hypothetical protein